MQKITNAATILCASLTLAGATASGLAFHRASTDIQNGERIYNQTCVACHGADGRGTIPGAPDFSKNKGPLFKSNDTLFDHTKNGFRSEGSPMAMPAKGGNRHLSDQDIKDVIAYLHKAFK